MICVFLCVGCRESTLFSRSYVVGGSETWRLKSRQIFPKLNVTVGRVVPYCLSSPRKKIYVLMKVHKTCNLKSVNLRRRHFLLICRRVTWIVISISNNVDAETWIPEYDLKKSNTEAWRDEGLYILPNLFAAKNHPRNYSSTCSSLFFPINGLRHLDAKFIESKPLSQIWKCDGPISTLRLRFLSFLKAALFPNVKEIFTRVRLIKVRRRYPQHRTYEFAPLAEYFGCWSKRCSWETT